VPKHRKMTPLRKLLLGWAVVAVVLTVLVALLASCNSDGDPDYVLPSPSKSMGISPGTYLVGKDIPEGTYRSAGESPDRTVKADCTWAVETNRGGPETLRGSSTGPVDVSLTYGDTFTTKGCFVWNLLMEEVR
jgi:hypothetical protein